MNTLTIPLKDGEYELLADLARYLEINSPETMLRRSVDAWLGETRWRLRQIEESRRCIERGELIDHEDVVNESDEWIAGEERILATAAE